MSARYRLNEPDVSAEVFDEEVLAINLKTGHYHSLRETGVVLWQALMQGHTVDEAVAALAGAFPDAADAADSEGRSYIQKLEEDGLIVPSLETVPPNGPLEIPSKGTYVSPQIESYTDMQELLLIDPIHEVDVYTGWPQKSAP
jgi:hypothetical protein